MYGLTRLLGLTAGVGIFRDPIWHDCIFLGMQQCESVSVSCYLVWIPNLGHADFWAWEWDCTIVEFWSLLYTQRLATCNSAVKQLQLCLHLACNSLIGSRTVVDCLMYNWLKGLCIHMFCLRFCFLIKCLIHSAHLY